MPSATLTAEATVFTGLGWEWAQMLGGVLAHIEPSCMAQLIKHPTLALGSGRDLAESSPVSVSALAVWSLLGTLSLSLSLPFPCLFSLSQINIKNIFENIYLFLRQRETEHEQRRGRERERYRIRNRLQALSCQHRAQCRARTPRPRDHDPARVGCLTD